MSCEFLLLVVVHTVSIDSTKIDATSISLVFLARAEKSTFVVAVRVVRTVAVSSGCFRESSKRISLTVYYHHLHFVFNAWQKRLTPSVDIQSVERQMFFEINRDAHYP